MKRNQAVSIACSHAILSFKHDRQPAHLQSDNSDSVVAARISAVPSLPGAAWDSAMRPEKQISLNSKVARNSVMLSWKGVRMVLLDQNPPAQSEPFAPFADGLEWRAEDVLEKIQDAFMTEVERRLVAGQIGLAHELEILAVILIQFDDVLHQRFVTREIGAVQETARVELLRNQRVAPIERNAAGGHRVEDFFGGIARSCGIFVCDV